MNLHALFPYLWLAILVGSYIAAIVVAIMGRPKKPKAPKAGAIQDMAAFTTEGLDFGDELAQLEKK